MIERLYSENKTALNVILKLRLVFSTLNPKGMYSVVNPKEERADLFPDFVLFEKSVKVLSHF